MSSFPGDSVVLKKNVEQTVGPNNSGAQQNPSFTTAPPPPKKKIDNNNNPARTVLEKDGPCEQFIYKEILV